MSPLFKHFWIAFILVTCVNGVVWWVRGARYRERDPSLCEGYRSLILGFVVWANIPWAVMGIGMTFGGVPSMAQYLNPRSGDPFVLGFLGSVVLVWVAATYWLFFRRGAQELIRHPGILRWPGLSVTGIKGLWLVCLAAGIAAIIAMYTGEFPSAEF